MKIYYALILVISVLLLTSMSECKDHDGPKTMVNGTVVDAYNGEPYKNISLEIVRTRPSFSGTIYDDFDSIKTDIFGAYKLTFTPVLPGKFFLDFKNYYLQDNNLSLAPDSTFTTNLKLGQTNNINFRISKLIKLRINLKNTSSYNHGIFTLESSNCNCIRYRAFASTITKDTVLNFKVPRYTKFKINSKFFDAGVAGSKAFEQELDILNSDTTVSITN